MVVASALYVLALQIDVDIELYGGFSSKMEEQGEKTDENVRLFTLIYS